MRAHEKVAPTLRANAGSHEPVVFPQRAYGEYEEGERGSTLKAYGGNVGGGSENIACVYESNRKDERYTEMDIAPTLTSMMGTGGGNVSQRIARKLTPKECERLQGLPDGYTDYGSDSKRYKAIGNGMAQPCADYVMVQVAKAIRRGEANERENGIIGHGKESG